MFSFILVYKAAVGWFGFAALSGLLHFCLFNSPLHLLFLLCSLLLLTSLLLISSYLVFDDHSLLCPPMTFYSSSLSLQLFCKINYFPSFLFPSVHFSGCRCASCPSVLAVHLLCTWPCFCSCLFLPLLMIIQLRMSSPPIKA